MSGSTLAPRRVEFSWADLPLHWIPEDPYTTHLLNVTHLLLPAGERWFIRVFKEALPRISDGQLLADIHGFLGQEAVHARAHQGVLPHFEALGLDPTPYTTRLDWFFHRLLGEAPPVPLPAGSWLRLRLSFIAALEHFTCVLGGWMLAADLEATGADPQMLDLLRWHGAEEVEHRAVAFDAYQHVAGQGWVGRRWLRYPVRVLGMLAAFPMLWYLWDRGLRFLLTRDPLLASAGVTDPARHSFRRFVSASRQGRAPGGDLLRAIPRYLRPAYHPSQEASLADALAYLAGSPAALAAAAR